MCLKNELSQLNERLVHLDNGWAVIHSQRVFKGCVVDKSWWVCSQCNSQAWRMWAIRKLKWNDTNNTDAFLWPLMYHLFPFERRFWTFLPLGLLSLPTQWTPSGPVTRCDSRPFDDFLKVNSTASPSFRLRKPSMCNLLWKATEEEERH